MQRRYGGPETLALEEIDRPTVGSDQVLVRVRAAALNPTDYVVMRGLLRPQTGWRRPKQQVRGFDVAGIVEEVGADVTELAPGEAVFGSCRGSFGEYAIGVPERDDYLRGEAYDAIFDNGGGRSLRELRRALVPGGVVVLNCGHDRSLVAAGLVARHLLRRGDVKQFVRKVTRPDLLELAALVEDGSVTPVVGRTYPLAETAAAMSRLMQRHPRGKVVVLP